jgi:hypothetical protein
MQQLDVILNCMNEGRFMHDGGGMERTKEHDWGRNVGQGELVALELEGFGE